MFGAEVEHLLEFTHAADVGSGDPTPLRREGEDVHLQRLIRQSDVRHRRVRLEQIEGRIEVDRCGDRVDDQIERHLLIPHRLPVGQEQEVVCAQALGVVFLARGVGDQGDLGAHRLGVLEAHVTEPAQAHDPHAHTRPGTPRAQRRVGGDPRAQQRGRDVQPEGIGDTHDEVVLHDDGRGVTAVGDVAVVILAVIRTHEALGAVLLEPCLAVVALTTGIDEHADAHPVPGLERRDLRTDLADNAGDLVSGHHREDRGEPLLARLVDVRVADPGVLDVDEDITRTQLASLDGVRLERGSRGQGCVG